jgi:hypothetical protein
MSSRNDDNSPGILVLALIGALAYVALLVVAFIASLVAFVMTFMCLYAWMRPARSKPFCIERAEGRSFILRGLAGAVLVPAFFVFLEIVFGIYVRVEYAFHFMAAGYILGSVGIEILMAQEQSAAAQASAAQLQNISQQEQRALPPAPPQFRYASWDDEEACR